MKRVKDAVKNYKRLLGTNPEEAKKVLSTLYKQVDKLAKTKYIAKNKASRLKSRMAKKLRP